MSDLFGLPVEDLPEGWQPVEVVAIVKCLRPDGTTFPYGLCSRVTDGLSPWEAAGMAEWAHRSAIQQLDEPKNE
jgi:hypothetical protein